MGLLLPTLVRLPDTARAGLVVALFAAPLATHAMVLLFSGLGLGLAGRVPLIWLPAVAVVILATQRAAGVWWLHTHAQGPAIRPLTGRTLPRMSDFRAAVRRCLRQPGFSLAWALLLRPLPFPDADRIVTILLSHQFWRQRFGARADIVGQSLVMDGGTYRIAAARGTMAADQHRSGARGRRLRDAYVGGGT